MNCHKKMSLSNLFRNKQDEMRTKMNIMLSQSVAQGDTLGGNSSSVFYLQDIVAIKFLS